MSYSGVIEDFQRIRESKIPRRIPVVACSEEFDVRWYGKYSYEEFCQDGNCQIFINLLKAFIFIMEISEKH